MHPLRVVVHIHSLKRKTHAKEVSQNSAKIFRCGPFLMQNLKNIGDFGYDLIYEGEGHGKAGIGHLRSYISWNYRTLVYATFGWGLTKARLRVSESSCWWCYRAIG